MSALRHARYLARLVLAWFVLSLGVAVASPIVHPQALELVCSGSGVVKVVVQGDEGAQELASVHIACPLCIPAGAPPPLPVAASFDHPPPQGHAVQSIPAARVATAAAAPLPARGPPLSL